MVADIIDAVAEASGIASVDERTFRAGGELLGGGLGKEGHSFFFSS